MIKPLAKDSRSAHLQAATGENPVGAPTSTSIASPKHLGCWYEASTGIWYEVIGNMIGNTASCASIKFYFTSRTEA